MSAVVFELEHQVDDWAEALVQEAAVRHMQAGHVGYTMQSSGAAWCGRCGWRLSARPQDVGTMGGALFAYAALGRVGEVVALAIGTVAQAVAEAVLP